MKIEVQVESESVSNVDNPVASTVRNKDDNEMAPANSKDNDDAEVKNDA